MQYINRKTNKLIIDTSVYKTITKQKVKDGTIKDNAKYIAHIPNMLLIFLLERYKPFDADTDADYIDAMINAKDNDGKKLYYLTFYDHPGNDGYVALDITRGKSVNDDAVSVTVKKQVTSNSYNFTISKKVFKELTNDDNAVTGFRFVLDLDCDGNCFKNSMIYVKLI